jgi:hypothetical protein
MSSKRRLAIVPSAAPSDPARLRLDQAIKAAAKAKAKLAGRHAAIERARQQASIAQAKAEEARSGVDAARYAFEGQLAEAISHGAPLPATSSAIKVAETAAADAQRIAEATAVACDRLRADLRNVEIEEHLSRNDIATCVDQIIAPLAERILERGEQARRTLFECAAVLNFLARPDDAFRFDQFWKPDEWRVSSEAGAKRRAPMGEVNERIARFLAHFRQDIDLDVERTLAAWKQARAALKLDPSATMPALPGDALD